MQYMLLVYFDPKADPSNTSDEETNAIYAEYAAVASDKATKHSAQLDALETAKTVRIKDGSKLVTDGPFAETKEALGGYYLLDVADLDAALAWAAKVPNAGYGSIEVRPVVVFDDTGMAQG
jgi:hypothetical protein